MNRISIKINTNDLILYHLIQRFVYQYHSLFSRFKGHPSLEDFAQLWYIKIFFENSYFKNMPNAVLVDYEIKENKDLQIIVRAPLYYKSFLVSLDKDIFSCVTLTDNEKTVENINIFSIDYII